MCIFAVFAPWYCTSKCRAVIFAGSVGLCPRLTLAIARHASADDFAEVSGAAAHGVEPPHRKLAAAAATRRSENDAKTEALDMAADATGPRGAGHEEISTGGV